MISTKGRYALRVMLDLAEHGNKGYIPLKDIAKRQNISDKYLESILKSLVKQKMLKGLRGKGGGYQLTRTPAEYSVGEILEVAEGSLAPVACLCGKSLVLWYTTFSTALLWKTFWKIRSLYQKNKS